MLARDSRGAGLRNAAVQGGLCAIVALLLYLAADRVTGIERGLYDFYQRILAETATAPVVVVDTGAGEDPWSRPDFADLVSAIAGAGALAIVPATAPPPAVRSKDISKLRTLLALESRAGGLQGTRKPGLLERQIAEAGQHLAQQERMAAAFVDAGNVILPIATTERGEGQTVHEACAAKIASMQPAAEAAFLPRTVGLHSVAPELCSAAAAVAHQRFPVDGDGVMRRSGTFLQTAEGLIPPAAWAALSLDRKDSPALPSDGNERLIRFHASSGGGLNVVTAAEALAAPAERFARRYVVIGPLDPAGSGFQSPLGQPVSTASLIATEIANLYDDRQLVRGGWATGLEILIALALSALAVLSLRLRRWQAIAAAFAATSVLLLAEYAGLALGGTWLKLASLALFCPLGVGLLLAVSGAHPVKDAGRDMPGRDGGPPAPNEELDLGFSVLRQQPTTDRTKQQLYDLAMEHGRNRDYARAERVFRHLAARDPGYRDVAQKLEKLSGARNGIVPAKRPETPARQPDAVPVPAGVRTLGRYELERVLGRGAMATVYLGRDPTINRHVAVKTLPLAEEFVENDLATARSHFLREAESAGRLNHPNIISIHDAGEDNRVAYLAMEYFEGKPLNHYAQLGRLLPPRIVMELMARAAEALHYAHSQNVVHRDVKPANLMYDADTDRLKLTDFGIARLTDSSRTRTGIILGTPSYMSPEQLSASKVTGQSDLYSLGVTMYHLLIGSPPFQADSIPRLMDKIVNQKHKPVRDIRDDVPACADAILDRALAKDPADRYPDGQAMALALRDCCSSFRSDLL